MQTDWNQLYRRAIDKQERPPAEVDSVPLPEEWGALSPAEWEAQSFLLPYLGRYAHWLDLGCGTGSVLAAFLRRHEHASGVGLDVAEDAISYGNSRLRVTPELSGRMQLLNSDFRLPDAVAGRFDFAFALFSLQCLRLCEFNELVSHLGRALLASPGAFGATVRSTARSVPASYVPDPEEPNTYLSHEPHELGMSYHHYTREEIEHAAELLGGRFVHIHHVSNQRAYDSAPDRGWWSFVIER
jgi:SAM-dependent methyltransferase